MAACCSGLGPCGAAAGACAGVCCACACPPPHPYAAKTTTPSSSAATTMVKRFTAASFTSKVEVRTSNFEVCRGVYSGPETPDTPRPHTRPAFAVPASVGKEPRMKRIVVALVVMASLMTASSVLAQGGDGSLRGSVRDSQGGALPGVTITATSDVLLSPSVTVTDSAGNYRLINLPPGTFTVTAQLAGFSTARREGVLLRAGSNFQVDMTMELGALEESITVSGDAPMLEVTKPSNVLTIDAEFQKEAPVVEGKFWSDFLMLTPGVISRPHNDASGRQNYFGNAVEHRDAVTLMEGLYAGNYNDFNINRTGLSSEAIQDTEVKTGGVDAG